MAVRIGKFGMSWLQPAGQAADLLVEAGRAKGAGIAALGQGIGQGLATVGNNIRADKIRSQDMALREQSRQDALAERAADNARQDAEFAMRQDAWKVEVLTANRDKAMQEAQMLAAAAQDLGDPDIVQRAQAAASEAQRFGTALDTLLSSRMGVHGAAPSRGGMDTGGVQVGGKPMSQMTDAELSALMDKSARGEVDYSYRGGATGDMGQGVGNVPSSKPATSAMPATPGMVNDGGVMSGGPAAAPMAAPTSMPQIDMKDPYVLMRTAEAKMKRADDMLRDPKLGAAARNAYERLQVESAAQYGFAQSELKRREQAQEQAAKDADEARKAAADQAEVDKYNEQARKEGRREITNKSQIAPVTTGEMTDARAEANRTFKAQQAAERRLQQDRRDLRAREWAVEDRDIREGRMSAKDAAMMAQRDIAEAGRAVGRAQTELEALNDSFRANKATKEELTEAANALSDAKDFYEKTVARSKMVSAPTTAGAGGDAMSKAEAEYNALPPDQRTPENAVRIAEKYGVK